MHCWALHRGWLVASRSACGAPKRSPFLGGSSLPRSGTWSYSAGLVELQQGPCVQVSCSNFTAIGC